MFELHPRLTADTLPITRLEACGVYLMNDKRYPWLVLVPRIEDTTELHRLSEEDYYSVQKEVRQVSTAVDTLFKPKKMNIGALGNLVPQLHIHIIARFENDETWPGPVWGVGKSLPYSQNEIDKLANDLQNLLINI